MHAGSLARRRAHAVWMYGKYLSSYAIGLAADSDSSDHAMHGLPAYPVRLTG